MLAHATSVALTSACCGADTMMESIDFFLGLTKARFRNMVQMNKNSELFQALASFAPPSSASNTANTAAASASSTAAPLRPNYPLSEAQTRWLAVTAFVIAFQRKQTAWLSLLARLRATLEQLEAGQNGNGSKQRAVREEVRAVSDMFKRFIRPQSAPVFDNILY